MKMSIIDLFHAKKYKARMLALEEETARLKSVMTPDMMDAASMTKKLETLNAEIEKLSMSVGEANRTLGSLNEQIEQKKKLLLSFDNDILVQDFGLYRPNFSFSKAEQYKDKLDEIRQKEADLIKSKCAVLGAQSWTVNGNQAKGNKMVSDMQKLLLRAFNSECDELVDKVKFNNIELCLKRIEASKDAISKLGSMMGVSITAQYFNYKLAELKLAYEYQQKLQEEKEERKEEREKAREAEKLQKEIEEQRSKTLKEQAHYSKALTAIQEQIRRATPEQIGDLKAKEAEIEGKLTDIDKSIEDIDYREANQKAGYVYIISNIGAFGENVYKIGMTRRLDPMERIDELGDASVPFDFDVHAMIFCDDAPALEAALHKAFATEKVNMVNQRREFFHVSLKDIKRIVQKNYDKTVEFVDIPEAEQYRISEKMRKEVASQT